MIKESAILLNGKIWTGKRHSDIIKTIFETTGKKPVMGKEGFITEDGKFVERKEALGIALKYGQLKGKKKHHPLDRLMSEDLY